MRLSSLALLTLLVVSSVRSQVVPFVEEFEVIRLRNGKVLQHATITAQDAGTVTFRHDRGVSRVDIPDLPPEFRSRIKYDSEAAFQQFAREAEQEALLAEQRDLQKMLARLDSKKIPSEVTLKGRLQGGWLATVSCRQMVRETYREYFPAPLGETQKFRDHERKVTKQVTIPDAIVFGIDPDAAPGSLWRGLLWPAGKMEVKDVSGKTHFQDRLATTPEMALRLGGASIAR